MRKIITYGTFDLFHEGHFNLIKRAKALGDYLIVGVTTEQFDEARGKLNVVDSLITRIDNVRGTGFADEIIVEDHVGQKAEDITKHDIDIVTAGSDWMGAFDYLKDYCEVVYLDRTRDISSSVLRMGKNEILKIGVIGTGNIACRFIPESKSVSGVHIVGAYNPKIESAKTFTNQFELSFATDDLNVLFDKTDAVYIASPHGTHYAYICAALNADKHVLCEKPMVLKKSQAEHVFALANKKNLTLMEGMKTAFCPGFAKLTGVARSGAIGSIKDVEACFTKLIPNGSREYNGADAGAFFELASYPLFAITKLLGTEWEDVHFHKMINENGVDYYSKAYFYNKNNFATAKVGIGVKSEGEMIISGTEGYILVKAPWWKTTQFEVRHEDTSMNEPFFTKFQGDGLRYVINGFISAINGYDKAESKLTQEESIFIAGVMERFNEMRGNNV